MFSGKRKKFVAVLLASTLSFPFHLVSILAEDTLLPTPESSAATDANEDITTDTEGTDTAIEPEVDADNNIDNTTEDTVDFNVDEEPVAEEDNTEEITTSIVYSWSWIDEDENLTYYDDQWYLALMGASEEYQATPEDVESLLPTQIYAQTDNGIETLDITWDLTSLPPSAYTGDYDIHACLPELYVLDTDADTLDVVVSLGGVETYSATTDITNNHLVQGITPRGVTMNLFDYWLTDEENSESNPDGYSTTGYTTAGINNNGTSSGHTLKFTSKSIGTEGSSMNAWTKSSAPCTGIVAATLGEDGYPKLAGTSKTSYSSESLSYLFDDSEYDADNSSSGTKGKHAYMGVTNLLQIDSDGYYYYKASQGTSSSSDSWESRDGNFASFDKETNSFRLYDKYGVYYTTALADRTIGSFFPFNTAEQVFSGEDRYGDLQLDTSVYPTSSILNHFFGLTMSTKFIQQNGGKTSKGAAITYEFTGDDDIWVFIDGVLVADLGGIHDAASLKIDFSTGNIYINGIQNGTLLSKYTTAGKADGIAWNGNTFADNTYHTLNFYYLERGAGGSNMALKFNLVTVPETEIDKIDQMGNAVPGATFEVYACEGDGTKKSDTPVATGTTDSDGVFVLQDTQGKILKLNEIKEEQKHDYLLLVETGVPAGYRKSEDLILRIDKIAHDHVLNDSSYVLTCMNSTVSGGYASSRVLITAPENVYYADDPTGNTIAYGTKGELFPVIMKYVGTSQDETSFSNPDNWVPITGNQVDGWKTGSSSSMEAIITAAQENGLEFDLTSSGSYQVQINDLPGDINSYYLFHTSASETEVEYAMVLYYTTADSLEEATADNTRRVYDPHSTDDKNSFTRQLSSKIYVPNISNTFYVQKMDEKGNVLDVTTYGSASFTLYSDEACTTSVATRSTSDSNDLNLSGLATFTKLTEGTYYLKETSAPNGFDVSDQVVKVIVNSSGVFVNAGTADDGVKVELGPGVVLQSLAAFANGSLDYTLHDITATMTTSEDAANWTSTGKTMHLSYSAINAILEYGEVKQEGDVDWPSGFTIDTGYAKLNITQWYDNTLEYNADKTELTDDISNLFATSTVVQIQDTPTQTSPKLIKTDQNGDPVANAGFTLYGSNENYDKLDIIGTFTTDSNGTVIIADTNNSAIKLKDLYAQYQYLYLEETSVPDGYRKTANGHLKLVKQDNGDVTIESENPLESGIISTNRVIITVPKTIYSIDNNSKGTKLAGGTVFVVLTEYVGGSQSETDLKDASNWKPIYGNSIDGWNEAANFIEAAQYSNYVFANNTLSIDDIPGDIDDYYCVDPDSGNVKYNIVYYYTSASDISSANASNTQQIYVGDNARAVESFASTVHVSNIGNTLYVQKLDGDGNILDVATYGTASFGLYSDSACTNVVYTQDTSDTNALDLDGLATFNGIAYGVYYLKEISAPNGFTASSSVGTILVSNTGVTVDSHAEDIETETNEKILVHTLKQYADESGISADLYSTNTIVKVKNEQQILIDPSPGKLTIYKMVKNGDSQTNNEEFEFSINLKYLRSTYYGYENYSGSNVTYTKSDGSSGTIRFNNGNIYRVDNTSTNTIKLKNGESIVLDLSNLTYAYGGWYATYTYYRAKWTVSESQDSEYTTSIQWDETNTNISSGSSSSVSNTTSYGLSSNGDSVTFVNSLNTQSFSFIKTTKDGHALEGAKFGLYKQICENEQHDHSVRINVDTNGNLSEADKLCWEEVATATSTSEGNVSFSQLIPDRTYRLVEYKVPEGYMDVYGQWYITQDDSGSYVVSGSIENPPAFEIRDGTYYVRNYVFEDLPHAGSKGIKKYLIGGSALMLVGMTLLIKNLHENLNDQDGESDDQLDHIDKKTHKRVIPIWKRRKRL